MSEPARPKGGEDLALYLVVAVAATSVLLWLGGAGSALLSGHRVHGQLLAGLEALTHPLHPAQAWGSPVGPVALYWAVSVVMWLVAAAMAYELRRIVRALAPTARPRSDDDPRTAAGLATRRQVRTAAGERALLEKAPVLRPSLSRPTAAEVGFYLGKSHGTACFASVRDSLVVLGPPGAGKGLHLVIPFILDAPGPVITTSTRPDNLAVTLARRTEKGGVAVFDPQGLAPGESSTTRRSPIRGCERPQVAMARAQAVAGGAARGTEHSSFWTQQTLQATRCLLHAAALGGRSAFPQRSAPHRLAEAMAEAWCYYYLKGLAALARRRLFERGINLVALEAKSVGHWSAIRPVRRSGSPAAFGASGSTTTSWWTPAFRAGAPTGEWTTSSPTASWSRCGALRTKCWA